MFPDVKLGRFKSLESGENGLGKLDGGHGNFGRPEGVAADQSRYRHRHNRPILGNRERCFYWHSPHRKFNDGERHSQLEVAVHERPVSLVVHEDGHGGMAAYDDAQLARTVLGGQMGHGKWLWKFPEPGGYL